jgi:hypothetical protein
MQHGNRGRSRPWALSPPQQQLILRLAHGKYQRLQRFSLNGKIRTQENLAVSRETVRRIFAIGSNRSKNHRSVLAGKCVCKLSNHRAVLLAFVTISDKVPL